MTKVVYTFLLFLITFNLLAEDHDDLIAQASKDYSEGLYNNAILKYNSVIENGYESPELFYNLGNSYFKLNDLASAILYYEKAKKLMPNDEDINFNLNIANSRITDKIESLPVIFYKRWWSDIQDLFNADAWAKIQLITFIFLLLLLMVYIISKRIIIKKAAFIIGLIFLVVSIFSFGMSYQKYKSFTKHDEAIVFDPSVTIKSSPTENSVDLFVVHEGTKIKIVDTLGEWHEIKIANGSSGWIQSNSIRKI